jgi:hypothetical protein
VREAVTGEAAAAQHAVAVVTAVALWCRVLVIVPAYQANYATYANIKMTPIMS